MWVAGIDQYDDASMRVVVTPGGPAAEGGVRDGDRIEAVNGQPVRTWDALRGAVARHPGEPIDLALSRDGTPLHTMVTPDREGRIHVKVPAVHTPAGFGACAAAGALGPAQVLYLSAQRVVTIVVGRSRAGEVAGPLAIVRETAQASEPQSFLLTLGAVASYVIPVLAIAAALTGPGRAPSTRAPRRLPDAHRLMGH
jgi:membrane-associated protease RseP (regulator of RpoE activity)